VNDSFNPYAPPAANVEHHGQVGEVWRDGKLVAMHREGQLPPRCVACNAPALARRYERTLYWTPFSWRGSVIAVLALLFALSASGVVLAALAFWPVVLIAAVTNIVIRKRVPLSMGVCLRHRRVQTAFTASALAGVAAVAGGMFYFIADNRAGILFALVILMFALGIARSRSGALAVRIARMSEERLWLKGTGAAFRASLPEAPSQ
jgi:hypothetical protein